MRIEVVYVTTGLPGESVDLSAPGEIGSETPAAATFTRLTLADLPTEDPVSAGKIWNDGGTLKVSAGDTAPTGTALGDGDNTLVGDGDDSLVGDPS